MRPFPFKMSLHEENYQNAVARSAIAMTDCDHSELTQKQRDDGDSKYEGGTQTSAVWSIRTSSSAAPSGGTQTQAPMQTAAEAEAVADHAAAAFAIAGVVAAVATLPAAKVTGAVAAAALPPPPEELPMSRCGHWRPPRAKQPTV